MFMTAIVAIIYSKMSSISDKDKLWNYFTETISSEITKYQVRDESMNMNIGNMIDTASQRIDKTRVSS